LVLSALGGAGGLVLGVAALKVISPIETEFDSTALWFLLAISLATALVFALAPLHHAWRSDPMLAIKSGAVTGGGNSRLRGALVIVEFALAMVLVCGAGMLLKSFARLIHVDPGFDPHGLVAERRRVVS
jgi:hypothetical protein